MGLNLLPCGVLEEQDDGIGDQHAHSIPSLKFSLSTFASMVGRCSHLYGKRAQLLGLLFGALVASPPLFRDLGRILTRASGSVNPEAPVSASETVGYATDAPAAPEGAVGVVPYVSALVRAQLTLCGGARAFMDGSGWGKFSRHASPRIEANSPIATGSTMVSFRYEADAQAAHERRICASGHVERAPERRVRRVPEPHQRGM